MPTTKLPLLATAFAFVTGLLMQFHQDIALPKWLTPFSLTGLLGLLMLVLPWMQKGSALGLVVGYLAIAFLMINLAILFTLAHLPSKVVKVASQSSSQAGVILLGALGTGLKVMVKSSATFVMKRMARIGAVVINSIHARTNSTSPQKLLGYGIEWV